MPGFSPFGTDHRVVLALTGLGIGGLTAAAGRLRRRPDAPRLRTGLAFGLVANELAGWARAIWRGSWTLPLHLCDLAVFLMAWALLGRRRLVGELAVCWGLAGSLQAVLTPDLRAAFPSIGWAQFFVGHCGLVLSAVYLLAIGRVRLEAGAVWRVWAMTNGYVLFIGLVNWRLGTNFGYLAHKPSQPSLLDCLGPWPYYVVGMEVVGLVLFFACLGVSRLIDRWGGANFRFSITNSRPGAPPNRKSKI